ncbi:hypothetical protein FPOAC2_10725 [Fusarium poae]|uniref:Uncharacterized protein n=1 Tax=Fusarium poae TaxID=36050 RepID=A0A1B8ABX0_FUSPO|nr:hypothetical protein FPOAC1_010446 [Fusarium poae]KAG8665647.1 hypothetical protein FPOAC1_010446 [Fusarium poae]OBS17945.1 hypothetical protein FPOA_09673 [Fusarium poae]
MDIGSVIATVIMLDGQMRRRSCGRVIANAWVRVGQSILSRYSVVFGPKSRRTRLELFFIPLHQGLEPRAFDRLPSEGFFERQAMPLSLGWICLRRWRWLSGARWDENLTSVGEPSEGAVSLPLRWSNFHEQIIRPSGYISVLFSTLLTVGSEEPGATIDGGVVVSPAGLTHEVVAERW